VLSVVAEVLVVLSAVVVELDELVEDVLSVEADELVELSVFAGVLVVLSNDVELDVEGSVVVLKLGLI